MRHDGQETYCKSQVTSLQATDEQEQTTAQDRGSYTDTQQEDEAQTT